MESRAILTIIASGVTALFMLFARLRLREPYGNSLACIFVSTCLWQFFIGLELYGASRMDLAMASAASRASGVFAQLMPACFFLFAYRFFNREKRPVPAYVLAGVCLASGLLSPWGISRYAIEDGRYVTDAGPIAVFHMFLWIGITLFSFGYVLARRFLQSDMDRLEAKKADVIIAGLILSSAAGSIAAFYLRDTFLAAVSPLLFFVVAVFGIPYVRHFVLSSSSTPSKMHAMPAHVRFRGPHARERETAFRELGMYVEVKHEEKEYIRKAMAGRKRLFPEQVSVPPGEPESFPLAVLRCGAIDAYIHVLTKDDGIVHPSDLDRLDEVFGGRGAKGGGPRDV